MHHCAREALGLAVAKMDANVGAGEDRPGILPSCCIPCEVGLGVKGEMNEEGPTGILALRLGVVGEFTVLSFVPASTIPLVFMVKYM